MCCEFITDTYIKFLWFNTKKKKIYKVIITQQSNKIKIIFCFNLLFYNGLKYIGTYIIINFIYYEYN